MSNNDSSIRQARFIEIMLKAVNGDEPSKRLRVESGVWINRPKSSSP